MLPNRHDPRLRLAAVTTSLHVLGQITFDFNLSIAQILMSLLAAAVVEFSISFFRDHRIAWPASALLTGNSVALILRVPGTEHGDWWSMRGWYIFAATSALAIASKYVIRWKGAHFFNPSNLMLVVVFLALGESRVDPQILWWGPWSIGLAAGFVVILGGSIAVTHHVRQLRTSLAFWVPFALLMGVLAASGHAITTNWHVGPLAGWPYWVTLVLSPEVMVFAFFMITDPKASPVTDRGKVIFGFIIALLSAVFVATQTGEFGTKVGILAGLVVLCPAIPFINARTGAPVEPVPTGSPFIASPDGAPTGASAAAVGTDARDVSTAALVRSFTPRHGVVAVVAFALVAAMVYVAGTRWSFEGVDDTGTSANIAALERRGEITLDDIELPPVELDDTAARSAFRLTPEVADRIATDTVLDLLLEARGVAQRDVELAAAGTAGARFRTIEEAIGRMEADATVPPPAEVGYTIDSLTVTLFKPDDGPQTPPELAVRVTGVVSGQTGSMEMDTWFTVAQVGEHHLVTGAFDPDRSPLPPAPIDPTISGTAGLDPDSDAHAAETTTPATPEELAGLTLVDRSAEMGLTLPHARFDLGEGQNFRIGGAAVADIDGDGFPDIFLTRVGYPDVLYRNDGGTGFTEVTQRAGLSDVPADTAITGGSTAAVFVDLDGDGNTDLMTMGIPGSRDRVFLGDSTGNFTDATDQWAPPAPKPTGDGEGVDGAAVDGDRGDSGQDPGPSAGVPVGLVISDVDGDGRPDVLIVASEPDRIHAALDDAGIDSSTVCSPQARAVIDSLPRRTSGTRLLRNTGSGFEDITDRLGVDPSHIAANSARFVDLDGDGIDDLIITGGSCTTRALLNRGGTFTDSTAELGFDQIPFASGVAVFDADHDGRPDVFLAGVSYPSASGRCNTGIAGYDCSKNRLMLNGGDGTFSDAAEEFQVSYSAWSWGAEPVDLNNDGFEDLYTSNGMRSAEQWWSNVDPDAPAPFDWASSTDRLWLGAPDGPMRSTESATHDSDGRPVIERESDITLGRAVMAADFDRDGRMDLLIVDTSAPPTLLMNTTNNDNHWLGVDLLDGPAGSQGSGVNGAVVEFDLGDGRVVTRRVDPQRSYQAAGPAAAHIGLGEVSTIERLTIRWPDATTQVIDSPPVDRWLSMDRNGIR